MHYWLVGATVEKGANHNMHFPLLMQLTALSRASCRERVTQRKRVQRDPERVNVCPLMVKPCTLSDWLTGSAGAMLESNWVRVCELEERSLNVSHCCRRQTDSEKKNMSVSQCSDITHIHHQSEPLPFVMRHHQSSTDIISHQQMMWWRYILSEHGIKTEHQWLSYRTAEVWEVREEVLN